MWARFLAVILIALFIFTGISLVMKYGTGSNNQAERKESVPAMREAKNVVMYEKRLDSKSTFVIHAQSVTQETNEIFTMEMFRMKRSDGLDITGGHAKYDTGTSRFDVVGPMTVITADGWTANLTDLEWDRKNRHAVTNKPVMVRGTKGNIEADRAEFFDDFGHLQLSGRVHAKISQSILDDLNQ